MPRNKYPLTALKEHRDRKVDSATAELGEAVRAREAAEEAKRAAERERIAAEERAQRVRDAEAQRLARGELRAADLARASAWEFSAKQEISELARVVDTAETRAGEMRGAEVEARTNLASKKADADVVKKDQSRFDDRVKKAQNAAEEEAAEEVYLARHVAEGQRKA